jgi:hypothetical protein
MLVCVNTYSQKHPKFIWDVEHFPSMRETLDLIPSTKKEKKPKQNKKRNTPNNV